MIGNGDKVVEAKITEYADFYHESDFIDPPKGWIEIESFAPGITRAFVPPPSK